MSFPLWLRPTATVSEISAAAGLPLSQGASLPSSDVGALGQLPPSFVSQDAIITQNDDTEYSIWAHFWRKGRMIVRTHIEPERGLSASKKGAWLVSSSTCQTPCRQTRKPLFRYTPLLARNEQTPNESSRNYWSWLRFVACILGGPIWLFLLVMEHAVVLISPYAEPAATA